MRFSIPCTSRGGGVVQVYPWSARRGMHVFAKEEVPHGMGDVDIGCSDYLCRLLLRVSGGSSRVPVLVIL